jgi:uncharacterized protein
LLIGGVGYTQRVEPFWLDVQELVIRTEKLAATSHKLRIGHLSDFHSSAVFTRENIQECVRLMNAQSPDLIVLTGDFVDHSRGTSAYAEMSAQALASLHAPLGVYAVLGNHDYWSDAKEITAQLEKVGIQVLVNQRRRLTLHGEEYWLLGSDSAWEGHPDLDKLLDGVPETSPTILLVHEPDFVDQAALRGIDLQLSGHSHGGQVRFPFIGALFLPYLGYKYPMGLYRVAKTWLYTTRGVGVLGSVPFRLFCRPEITILTLASQ